MRHAPLLFTLATTFVATAVGAPQAIAQNEPAITCKDLVIPLSGLSSDTGLSIPLTAENLLQQCTSATGASLSLVNLKDGITLTPSPNSSQTVPFTVVDDKGSQASANIIVKRD